jgi:hypothetical protein
MQEIKIGSFFKFILVSWIMEEQKDILPGEFYGPTCTYSLTASSLSLYLPQIPGTELYFRSHIPLEKLAGLSWSLVKDDELQHLVTVLQAESNRREQLRALQK